MVARGYGNGDAAIAGGAKGRSVFEEVAMVHAAKADAAVEEHFDGQATERQSFVPESLLA